MEIEDTYQGFGKNVTTRINRDRETLGDQRLLKGLIEEMDPQELIHILRKLEVDLIANQNK